METRTGLLGMAALCMMSLSAEAEGMLTFDGCAETGRRMTLPAASQFTFAAWVKIDGWGTGDKPYPRIIDGSGFYLHPAPEAVSTELASLTLGVRSGNSPSAWNFGELLPMKRWAHLAVLGGTADGVRLPQVYVNGKLVVARAARKEWPAVVPGGDYVLGNESGKSRPFQGALADVRYEPRLLSEVEIAELAKTAPDGQPPRPVEKICHDKLPLVDLSQDTQRQTVIAEGTAETYQGHPTTALARDGRTLFCVWTLNHGGPCGPMARSTDGGRTWVRLDDSLPPSYAATHRNCPTMQVVWTPDSKERRLCIFSSKGGRLGTLMSRDDGDSWEEILPPAELSSGMPPTGFLQLKDGTSALFGQIRDNPAVKTDRPTDDQNIWMSVTSDGGVTWSPARVVAHCEQKNLCEPCALRSPDGSEICLLMRENRHTGHSMMCFSRDEGQTWTAPVDTCWGLSGDRHEGLQLADGRWLIAFRDRAPGSSTYGQYVGWVGTYEDIRQGRPGQYRIQLLPHYGDGGWSSCDTGYSGVEQLPDGTIVCTTYTHYRDDERKHSVVCMRFRIEEADALLARQLQK